MMKNVMQMQDRMKPGKGGEGGARPSFTGSNLSATERAKRLNRKLYERRMRQQLLKKQRQKKK